MNHRKIVGMGLLLLIVACVSVAWAMEAPPATTPAPVSFGVGFDVVLDGLVAATTTKAYGCPASSSFSCDEPCYPQRVNCFNNCNGDWECISTCMICWRVCEFTC